MPNKEESVKWCCVLYSRGIWFTALVTTVSVRKKPSHPNPHPLTYAAFSRQLCVPFFSVLRECSSFSCWSRRCRRVACSESRLCLRAFSWSLVCRCCFLRRRSRVSRSCSSSHSQRSLVWLIKYARVCHRRQRGLWFKQVKFYFQHCKRTKVNTKALVSTIEIILWYPYWLLITLISGKGLAQNLN